MPLVLLILLLLTDRAAAAAGSRWVSASDVADSRMTSEMVVTSGTDNHRTSTSLEASPPSQHHEPRRSHRPSLDICAAFL